MKINKYPIVLKNAKSGKIEIVYNNRVEFYSLTNREADINGFDEIRMARENGYKFVNSEYEKEINI